MMETKPPLTNLLQNDGPFSEYVRHQYYNHPRSYDIQAQEIPKLARLLGEEFGFKAYVENFGPATKNPAPENFHMTLYALTIDFPFRSEVTFYQLGIVWNTAQFMDRTVGRVLLSISKDSYFDSLALDVSNKPLYEIPV